MRTSFAILKGFTFTWLLALAVMDEILLHWDLFPSEWIVTGLRIGYWTAIISAAMSLVRGVPVVIEGVELIQRERPNG